MWWNDAAKKNLEEKMRQKENEERNKQYNQLPPYLKKKLGERREQMKKDEKYLKQLKRKLRMDMGNQLYATSKETGARVDAQSMVEVVQELGLEEDKLEGVQREGDAVEIRLKDGVEVDLEKHNSNEENKYVVNRVRDLKNVVKLKGLNLLKNTDDWIGIIEKVMKPFAVSFRIVFIMINWLKIFPFWEYMTIELGLRNF